jgi:hypothetical protein
MLQWLMPKTNYKNYRLKFKLTSYRFFIAVVKFDFSVWKRLQHVLLVSKIKTGVLCNRLRLARLFYASFVQLHACNYNMIGACWNVYYFLNEVLYLPLTPLQMFHCREMNGASVVPRLPRKMDIMILTYKYGQTSRKRPLLIAKRTDDVTMVHYGIEMRTS